MSTLIFDIETIGESWNALDETTQEVLTRWIKKTSEDEGAYQAKLADLKNELGFSPFTGEIVAIGVLDLEKDKGAVYYQAPGQKDQETENKGIKFKPLSEKEMLEQFWQGVSKYQDFVSFNGRSFDVPYLMIRSAINQVRPSKDLLSNRYLSSQKFEAKHIDLLDQLTFYGASWTRKPSLHVACRAFGIQSPKAGGVTGDDVAGLFRDKKYLDIARYNVGDLRATKALYQYWRDYLKF
ncbi:MAG: ribonuclease H-like domain-containing protein [Patescibacteria group bacterium]